ncbi:MAG TPA: glycogen debranching protein GlgX [Dehalococcoidia bacterium]|nr:glycogen debranching protein GlgX [Dehalococcoidia bacterium]
MKIWPGKAYPLGATWDGQGTNFAISSECANRVFLCLYDHMKDSREVERFRLPEVTAHVWHGYLPDVGPGQLYGYHIEGPFDPEAGLRFNPNKLLLDPYARAIAGSINWEAPVFGYPFDGEDADLKQDTRRSDWGVPKCVVIDPAFDWTGDRRPDIPWHNSVIYEVHVRGLTMTHPQVPPELRGTYAGLASSPIIEYLQRLGVTAVELLPVHEFPDDDRLVRMGQRNYWGYNTLGFFAPAARYSSSGDRGEQVTEFKRMVKTLHQAGIEVILDVVYNHTAEGNHLGPTLSFRGIDNMTYYRLVGDSPRYYMDYTGTGNTLNAVHPQTLQLVMDSLRYWVQEMHVDGFRFDLASALARELYAVDRLSSFFDVIHQDPIISQVKLIAEPWDVGEGGYQVGNFPVLWTEWNGEYRDTVRRYWRGDESQISTLAYRLTGSSDLYQSDGRKPYASINFITAHDGFTLHDLVSYNEKHNEANGEDNRDGHNANYSWNCGVEGPTDDPEINALRDRQMRNFIATLFLSQGVPMLCGGDEIARTQRGNNNSYCQDNELSWYNWAVTDRQRDLLEFTRRMIRLRREQPVLRRRKFFSGRRIHGSDIRDLIWFRPDGQEMTDEEWEQWFVRSLTIRLAGDAIDEYDEHGERIVGDTLLILLNAYHEPIEFTLPGIADDADWAAWEHLISTAGEKEAQFLTPRPCGDTLTLAARSLIVFKRVIDPNRAASL